MKVCRCAILSALVFILLSMQSAQAATVLPKNLNAADQQRALQILGYGSAPKVLDNPYPLGGYSGVEIGLSSEFIPIEDLSNLGSQSSDGGELNYYTLSFGKGLYYNIDTHVYFTPMMQDEDVLAYGAQVRWGFYEASFFPLTLTALVYGGGANFSNLINFNTLGLDVIASVNINKVALYAGMGRVRVMGTFIGGAGGVTDNTETVKRDEAEDHSVFGVSVDFKKMFLALQVDRYTDSNYSGKIGFRF